jgi:hypothetical protein
MKYLAILAALAASTAIGYRIGRRVGQKQIKTEVESLRLNLQRSTDTMREYLDSITPVKTEPITPGSATTDTKAPATPDDWNKAFIVDMRREGNC